MAKSLTATPISHATAAGFKQWVTDLAAMLDFMGLAKTADTGQINIADDEKIERAIAVAHGGNLEVPPLGS